MGSNNFQNSSCKEKTACRHLFPDCLSISYDYGLNEHALLKKKFLWANHAPQMTKSLRKAIMRRSELESNYFKNSTIENKAKYKKQKKFCSKLYKKERKKSTQTY